MSFADRRVHVTTPTTEQNRLALLWKAFEEAEQRIRELESDLDRMRRVGPPATPPTPTAPAPSSADPQAIRALREAIERRDAEREAERVASHARLGEATRAIHALTSSRDAEAARLERAHAHAAEERERTQRALAELHAANERLSGAAHESQALVEAREAEAQRYARSIAIINHERTRAERAEEAISALERRVAEAVEEAARAASEADLARASRDLAHEALAAAREDHAEAMARATQRLAVAVEPARVVAAAKPRMMPVRPLPIDAGRVAEIPGVMVEEVMRLRAFGVNMNDALLYADLGALADATEIGAPRLWRLRAHAELMSLHGIGPEWASRLYAAGTRSVDDVARLGAEGLRRILEESHRYAGASDDVMALLARTLPARCAAVVDEAQRFSGAAGLPEA